MESNENTKPLRVFLWIVPRTNSTVFTKCMSFVDNTEVWMEPYMACNMNETIYNPEWGIGNPIIENMRAVVKDTYANPEYIEMKRQEAEKVPLYNNVWTQDTFSYPWVKTQLEVNPVGKQLIFIKEQSLAIYDHLGFLPAVPTRHAFLIRHPLEVYPSLKNLLTNYFAHQPWDETSVVDSAPFLPVKDLFRIHRDHWKNVKDNLDPDPIVIDGYDLASKPDVILPKFFAKLGVPYKESYLKWEADPEHVYSTWKGSSEVVFTASKSIATSRAVASTHFVPAKLPRGISKPEWKITEDLKECIDYSMPFYEEMYEHRLV